MSFATTSCPCPSPAAEPVLLAALERASLAAASCDIYFLRRAPDSRSSAALEERVSLADETIPDSELDPSPVVDVPRRCCCGCRFEYRSDFRFRYSNYCFVPERAYPVADASAVRVVSAPASVTAVLAVRPEPLFAQADFVPARVVPFVVGP